LNYFFAYGTVAKYITAIDACIETGKAQAVSKLFGIIMPACPRRTKDDGFRLCTVQGIDQMKTGTGSLHEEKIPENRTQDKISCKKDSKEHHPSGKKFHVFINNIHPSLLSKLEVDKLTSVKYPGKQNNDHQRSISNMFKYPVTCTDRQVTASGTKLLAEFNYKKYQNTE
jgi:hypothetical protein